MFLIELIFNLSNTRATLVLAIFLGLFLDLYKGYPCTDLTIKFYGAILLAVGWACSELVELFFEKVESVVEINPLPLDSGAQGVATTTNSTSKTMKNRLLLIVAAMCIGISVGILFGIQSIATTALAIVLSVVFLVVRTGYHEEIMNLFRDIMRVCWFETCMTMAIVILASGAYYAGTRPQASELLAGTMSNSMIIGWQAK